MARSASVSEPPRWRSELRDAIRTVGELLDELGIASVPEFEAPAAERQFPLRVPRSFVARMEKGNPRDPLLLQVLPRAAELRTVPGFVTDPLAEAEHSPVPGLLHKYRGRALLVVTGVCAVHCRYCFRRHFPYAGHSADHRPALDYLRSDPSVSEVLLSGGDPLSWTDEKLAELAASLAEIGHVRRLRLHTRLPVVLPSRVDDSFLRWLTAHPSLEPVVVIHANHPRELDAEVCAALGMLRAAGVTVLNQSVLLRGINDSLAVLRDLSENLFEAGVMPYYLHVLDPVAGAAHFEVPESEAGLLIRALTGELPGYLVPKLVREVPGAESKSPVLLPGV
ncbi:MAG: EF-P beta-lysylation protein EpmB [Holophagales bacterium]|nr:EF-P beta-lysylation protein EpmB [Holophagales bacterium]